MTIKEKMQEMWSQLSIKQKESIIDEIFTFKEELNDLDNIQPDIINKYREDINNIMLDILHCMYVYGYGYQLAWLHISINCHKYHNMMNDKLYPAASIAAGLPYAVGVMDNRLTKYGHITTNITDPDLIEIYNLKLDGKLEDFIIDSEDLI